MDAKRNNAKGSQPREGKATRMEGPDLESVIGRAQGHDAEALGRSIASMSGAYSACAVTCWTHGRARKMPPAKSSSSCSAQSRAMTGPYRSPGGCCGWL